MKLEQQVCSLELAKKLKELGVKQESLFHWYLKPYDNGLDEYWEIWQLDFCYIPGGFFGKSSDEEDCVENENLSEYVADSEQYSAFTVAELGEMLPFELEGAHWIYDLESKKEGGQWVIGYLNSGGDALNDKGFFSADTEADARAKMLIYLLENKLITL